MTNSPFRAGLARRCLLATFAFAALSGAAAAHDYTAGTLKVEHPWMRIPPAAAKVAGGFMKITNTGTTADRLIGGSGSISNKFEVHEMAVKDGVMTMRELDKGLEIKPGQTVELKPGSFHVMFIDLKKRPAVGDQVAGTLVFEKAGKIDIEFKVEEASAKSSGHNHDSKAAPQPKSGKAGAGSHANH